MSVEFEYALCDHKDVREYVKANHYSRTCPSAISHSFSITANGKLRGAAQFAYTAGAQSTGSIFKFPYGAKEHSRELARLVLDDDLPRNSESRFVGWILRYLKSHSGIKGLLSYADPERGHDGIIYRASNWLYTGRSRVGSRLIIDGKELHTRQVSAIYGTCSVKALRAQGLNVEVRITPPKHRYVYLLDSTLLVFVKYPIVPFVIMLLCLAARRARKYVRKLAKFKEEQHER
jgi:hypothetical protein